MGFSSGTWTLAELGSLKLQSTTGGLLLWMGVVVSLLFSVNVCLFPSESGAPWVNQVFHVIFTQCGPGDTR